MSLKNLITTDWWHSFTKLADHNRYTVAGAALFAAMITGACLPAFDGKTTSPFDGSTVSGEQLDAQADAFIASSQARYDEIGATIDTLLTEQARIVAEAESKDLAVTEANDRIVAERTALTTALGTVKDSIAALVPGSEAILGTVFTLGISALGLGVAADNRRKDRKIKILSE